MDQQKALEPELIVFDLDGTLVRIDLDWDKMKSEIRNYTKSFGFDKEMTPLVPKINEALEFSRSQHLDPERIKEGIYEIVDTYELAVVEVVEELISAREVLEKLGQKYKLGVLTNNGKKATEAIWKKLSFPKPDITITRNEVEHPKPNLKGIQLILNETNIKPEKVVIVGDTDYDIEIAKKIGAKSIWHRSNEKKKLNYTEPDYKIENLSELLSIFK